MSSQSDTSGGGESRPILRPGDSTPRRVLEAVLQQTSVVNVKDAGIHPEELEAMLEVARRFRGVEFQLDPIVIELVRVTIRRQLKNLGQTEDHMTAVAGRVARTLFEDAESHERLRSLWKQLTSVG